MTRRGERRGLGESVKGCLIPVLLVLCVWAAIGTYRACRPTRLIETLPRAEVYYYITPETAISNDSFSGPAGRSFAVTADAVLLKVGRALVELRRPDRTTWDVELEPQLLNDQLGDYDEIIADAGGVILVKRLGELLQLTGGGSLERVTALPSGGMHVAPSRQPGVAYVFGGRNDYGGVGLTEGSIFLLSNPDGIARRVAVLDSQPKALADASDGYYVGTAAGDIFQLRGDKKRLVITLPDQLKAEFSDGVLQSLACSDDGRILFFSTRDTVFALFGNTAVPVTKNLGGAVHWRDGVLFVWDEKRHFLVGISRIADALGLPAGS